MFMSVEDPTTLNDDDLAVLSLPDIVSTPCPPILQPVVTCCTRDSKSKQLVFEISISSNASGGHPLQDGVLVIPLPHGSVFIAVMDATTNAKVVKAEHATRLLMNRTVEIVTNAYQAKARLLPATLFKDLHQTMHSWMAEHPGARCGVAYSAAVIDASGDAQVCTIGDTPVWHFQTKRSWFQSYRLTPLTPAPAARVDGRLNSSLGQSVIDSEGYTKPLRLELAHAHLAPEDVLLMASDGGLSNPLCPDLLNGLIGYARDRRCLATLASELDSRARSLGKYDDDRSIVLVKRI
jgi:hypothetical protein